MVYLHILQFTIYSLLKILNDCTCILILCPFKHKIKYCEENNHIANSFFLINYLYDITNKGYS